MQMISAKGEGRMNIAIVEDDNAAATVIGGFVERYAAENALPLTATRYHSADDFLADTQARYAVVLLDVKMPGTSGMDAAFEFRKRDKAASVLFITSMTQLAQKGYEVDAVGYLVKPVGYYDFALKLKKAIEIYTVNEKRNVTITVPGGLCRISMNKLIYVEIVNHRLRYHLVDGVIEMSGALSRAEEELASYGMLRCNSCYLVNPEFIRSVRGNDLYIGDEVLRISRPKRQKFLEQLTEWYGGSAGGGE